MKTLLTSLCFVLFFLFSTMACQKNGKGVHATFNSPEEAAQKARSDLLEALRSARDLKLGFNAADLEKAQPAAPVRQYQITFEQLAGGDPAAVFAPSEQHELATVVPFVAENRVITVAEVARSGNAWRVSGAGDKATADELNVVRGAGGGAEVTIFELPHSGAKVYAVKGGEGQVFHTNYQGFELRQPVQGGQLLEVLRRDAAEFQRLHADELKQQKVVR